MLQAHLLASPFSSLFTPTPGDAARGKDTPRKVRLEALGPAVEQLRGAVAGHGLRARRGRARGGVPAPPGDGPRGDGRQESVQPRIFTLQASGIWTLFCLERINYECTCGIWNACVVAPMSHRCDIDLSGSVAEK